MNILVDCIRMVPQFLMAVPAVQQITEYTLLGIRRLWRTVFGLGNHLLQLFKGFMVNNRFVNIFEYCPVLLRIFKAGFVLKRFGISFEIDDIAAILLLRQYLLNGCLTPFVRIGLRLFYRLSAVLYFASMP